jgi:uncharacterized protein
MIPQLAKSKDQPFSPFSAPAPLHLYPHRLTDADRSEVLGFLKERPLHTAIMSGFIRDNGIENPLNRGTFHACRNEEGHLEGVALIGHAMFLDPRTDEAIRLFAQLAQECKTTHMIMGEQQVIQAFWNYYCARGQRARLFSRELLLELTLPVKVLAPVPNLRRATVDDLALVAPVHAALACGESGVNPLEIDPDGFRLRCRRRIERGRVWILVENGRLIFKADVISDTPEVNYVEGVYVDPAERRRGIASRCVTQMSFALSSRTKAISVLVNEEYGAALSFFQKVGFVPRAQYDTIFLDEKN